MYSAFSMQPIGSIRTRPVLTRSALCACLALASCTASPAPRKSAATKADAQAEDDAAEQPEPRGSDMPAPRGAGMPNVPIHRADAGAPREPDAAASTANLPPAATDAGRDSGDDAAADAMAPALDAGTPTTPPEPPPFEPQPVHRYAFNGQGLQVVDELGGADALLQGDAQLDGAGRVTFPGTGDGVVVLPEDALAGLTDFTALVWIETTSDACAQRALDFTYVQATQAGNQTTSLALTPHDCQSMLPALSYRDEPAFFVLSSPAQLERSAMRMLGVSFSSRSQTLRLIVDGQVQRAATVPLDMRALQRARGWLGRSHTDGEPLLQGAITELRIYSSRLEEDTLAELFARGPDAP
jgi:hypothetical protein